jgi:hypothetical protein
MKTASKTMYTIGMVYAILILVSGVIMAITGAIVLGVAVTSSEDPETQAYLLMVGAIVLSIGGYFALGQIVEIVMDNLGRHGGRGVQIANIVIGAICSNVFTLLGGAFGLASEDQIISE